MHLYKVSIYVSNVPSLNKIRWNSQPPKGSQQLVLYYSVPVSPPPPPPQKKKKKKELRHETMVCFIPGLDPVDSEVPSEILSSDLASP